MIKLKFYNKADELLFFKDLHYLSVISGCRIRFAEMISDLDLKEKEDEKEDD